MQDIAQILGLSQNEAVVAAFACGIVLGAMLARVSFGGARGGAGGAARGREARAPAYRDEGPELRRFTARNYAGLLHVAQTAAAHAPQRAGERLTLALAGTGSAWRMSRNRPDTEEVARELAESMRSNLAAAIDAGNAIMQARDLGEPAERRSVTHEVKRAGELLSAAFWERHGGLIRGSAMPASLKSKFEQFFAYVAALKKAIANLPAEPQLAQLAHVVEGVVELLNIAAAIAEEIEKVAAS
jgi:hypothetical protein